MIATAEMWEKRQPKDAGSFYDAACFRSLAAKLLPDKPDDAKAEGDRAIEWLTKAVKASYSDIDHIKKDTDLNAIRNRADFKKILADLEAKTPGPKPQVK